MSQPAYVRALADDPESIEETRRILQEVACARTWGEVEDILVVHRNHYFSLSRVARENLNDAIRDLMNEGKQLVLPLPPPKAAN
jgi:hypothetical protein